MKKTLKKFASLRITVVVLIAGMMLVLAGTLAQSQMPIREAQKIYFQSFVVWMPLDNGMTIPVLLGGYTIGLIMLANLTCAYLTTYKWKLKRSGILIMHAGIVMLLVGQLFTDVFSVESQMVLNHGDAKNYSEAIFDFELVIIDPSGEKSDTVYSIPRSKLTTGNIIDDSRMPVKVSIMEFLPNANLTMGVNTIPTQGFGKQVKALPAPLVQGDDRRNASCVYVDLIHKDKSLGRWLLSTAFIKSDTVDIDGKTYEIQLRHRRYMLPMTIQLQEFEHKRFTGTNTPAAFSSRIRLIDTAQNEDRSFTISMNQPLRYAGKTFYQAGFANDDKTTILQVVRNPAAALPYIACILVTLGMGYHFITHFIKFRQQQTKRDTQVQA
ncbi:MAG: cytochrome c biogenesis protein ResB [Phycisphaeraceae bacterium]|nr:cytochrome c biogenesis protein ResB [Phycisphaeraceae bacterium]